MCGGPGAGWYLWVVPVGRSSNGGRKCCQNPTAGWMQAVRGETALPDTQTSSLSREAGAVPQQTGQKHE